MPRLRLTELLRSDVADGVVLLLATLLSLALASSPWHVGWHDLWSGAPHHWVNDGLMTVFFFVVGLEITREVTEGELADPRTAATPVLAALGGMVVPALVFLAVSGPAGRHGWGIPMATDIAFALAVVALLARRLPPSLRLFLLTLAVVDDVGAIVVIAVAYADDVDLTALGVAVALVGLLVLLRRRGTSALAPHLVVGAALWVALDRAGVHPTLAGVVLATCTPPAWRHRLEPALIPVAAFVVLPIFALANAGVRIDGAAFDPPGATRLALAVGVGLVVGKLVGVTGATWLAVRTGLGRLPTGMSWAHLVGLALVAGIGFTVSLFVADLAFPASELEAAAKVGILAGSAVAAALGILALRLASTKPG